MLGIKKPIKITSKRTLNSATFKYESNLSLVSTKISENRLANKLHPRESKGLRGARWRLTMLNRGPERKRRWNERERKRNEENKERKKERDRKEDVSGSQC